MIRCCDKSFGNLYNLTIANTKDHFDYTDISLKTHTRWLIKVFKLQNPSYSIIVIYVCASLHSNASDIFEGTWYVLNVGNMSLPMFKTHKYTFTNKN